MCIRDRYMGKQRMDYSDLVKLKELIAPDDDDFFEKNNVQKGSVLNPGDIGEKPGRETAKPYAKIEAKVNTRGQAPPPARTEEIWQPNEVQDTPKDQFETRPCPDFEILYKQKVGAEDVFLGMSNIDPTSTKCQEILFKISLPDTKLKEISLDVTQQTICVQTPKFYLKQTLPHPVRDKDGKAEWVSDKNILRVSLPIIRDDIF
eukprot:TRINITY_DN3404_c0_g1_i2.p1 TRINITY_DN3404_c0_g1~~TRINITY_DN3404_c0_g1_i2.p1  ORF type:complete len:204 (-),score=51.51 TRINITY_DN3404_c0_g1_i2:429-1040(-)